MASEKELNVNLMERLHIVQRIRKVAAKEGATIEEVLEALDTEEMYIAEMLYQQPPLYSAE